MTEHDRARFGLALAGTAATFRQEATKALVHGYWMGLKDLEVEQVELGFAQAMRQSRFMPTVAEVRELAGILSGDDAALIAWETFQKAVSRHGAYASVKFQDRAINATVRNLGGWERLCGLPAEEFDKWLRKDFLAVYPTMAKSAAGPAGEALGGIHDRQNNAIGHKSQKAIAFVESEIPDHLRLPGTHPIERERITQRTNTPQIGHEIGRMP